MKISLKGIIAFILLICTLVLSMVSCDFAGLFNKNAGLEHGLNTTQPTLPNIRCAYRSDKNTFDIDDVTLEFFLGIIFTGSPEFNIEHSHKSYPSFDIYFSNDSKDKIVVRTVNENLISDKYRIKPVFDENGNATDELSYNYSEIFTVPKELFKNETGIIYFGIAGTNVMAEEPTYSRLASIGIYYKVANGKVTLSDKKFK